MSKEQLNVTSVEMDKLASVPKRIVKNIGLIFGGYVINLLGTLIVLVYLARHLSQKDFGIFNFGLAFVGLFAFLPEICTQQIIIREVSKNISKANVIIGNGAILKFLSGILAFILVNLSAIVLHYDAETLFIICLFSLGMFFAPRLQTFREAFEAIFHARLDMTVPSVIRIVDGLAVLLFVVVVLSFGGSLEIITLTYVLAGIPGLVIIVSSALRYVQPKFRLEKEMVLWLLKESLPLVLFLLFSGFYYRLDITMIQSLRGSIEVASYAAVYRLTESLSIIPLAFSSSTFPLISRYITEQQTEARNKVVLLSIKTLVIIGSCGAIATLLIGGDILTLLYDSKYQESLLPFQILMLGKLFQFFNFFSVNLIIAAGKQRIATYAMVGMLCVNVILNYITIPVWGSIGTSVARLMSDVVGFILFYAYIRHCFKVALFEVIAKIVIITLFAIGLCYGTLLSLPKIAAILIVSGFFTSAILLFKFFSKEELVVMRSLIKRSPLPNSAV
jgi:O-antigen/teichoic acid export membrane protein